MRSGALRGREKEKSAPEGRGGGGRRRLAPPLGSVAHRRPRRFLADSLFPPSGPLGLHTPLPRWVHLCLFPEGSPEGHPHLLQGCGPLRLGNLEMPDPEG